MKDKIVGVGALLSASFASICCLGPIVLVGLGLGGAGLAASLARYRPFFMVITALLLGTAFYMAYRKKEVACEDGTCELRSGGKTMKITLWAMTVSVIGMASFPQWSPYLFSNSTPVVSPDAQTVGFRVSGMFCEGCAIGIEKSLQKVPGVQSASVDFDKGEATVALEPGKVDHAALVKEVESAGPYSVQSKQ